MRRVLGVSMLAVLLLLLAYPVPSEAHGPRVFIGGTVWLGPGYWGPGPWWGPPYYPYTPPPVIVQSPPVYEQQAPPPQESAYWYYCQSPQGYYPYISQCPGGWMRVVPPASPPGQ